jgi:hypothetical protein
MPAMPPAGPPSSEPQPVRQPSTGLAGGIGGFLLQATGVLLFLFIPLVLYLFVRHPEPIAASLAAGVALMLGHRLLARPYMGWALPRKCVWCNRPLSPAFDLSTPAVDPSAGTFDLLVGGRHTPVRCCAAHRAPARRFFRFLGLARLPLRLGIFLPLLLLLGALAAAAIGSRGGPAGDAEGAGPPGGRFLPMATALFQLFVGLTVSAAAWGYLLLRRAGPGESTEIPSGSEVASAVTAGADGISGSAGAAAPLPVPFPAHNFFLLGVRLLLWIFRLVGAWWIWRGASFLLRSLH